ncbi:MAG: amidohydrolase family protein [Usitatibacteraceae bacterium]
MRHLVTQSCFGVQSTRLLLASALLSIAAVAPLMAATPATTTQTFNYTITIQTKVAGKQIVNILPSGKIKTEFTYRDNGRGPDIFEEITVGPSGQMESFSATGKSTFGAPIAETFSRKDGKATWKSKADAGDMAGVASAVYIPVESSMEASAIVIRALLNAPGNKLPALPAGQLSIARVLDAPVVKGSTKGEATLYQVAGISLEPNYVWMWKTAKPATARMFGIVAPGFNAIETGWEGNAEALLKLQIAADSATLKKLAAKSIQQPAGITVFRNVRWFDAEAAQMKGPADVYVNRGKIAAIYPANSTLTSAATVVDGSGRTLLPGLFDMHGHTSAWDSVLQVAGGVTTLRDMGNVNRTLGELQTRIDAGESVGPHIVATGFIEGASPFSSNADFVVKDAEEAKRAIDWYSQHGYRQIKLYNSIRPEWVAPIAEYAKARGMRVSGHIPAFMRAEEAVRAGFDEIQHINQVVLNFLTKKDDDTRTLLRFYLVGDNANQIDLESKAVKDFIQLLVDKKTAVDPTMTAFEAMFLQRQGAANPSYKFVANNVPPTIRRAWLTNSMDVTDKNEEAFRKSYEKLMGFVKLMHTAGVPLLAGTDDIAGFTLHRELELYALAGISPSEVLKIATWNGAKYSQVLERTGSITVGKDADLILVEGDPSKNISDIRKVSLVMKSGAIQFPAEIYTALGVKPFVNAPVLTKVAEPVAGK